MISVYSNKQWDVNATLGAYWFIVGTDSRQEGNQV